MDPTLAALIGAGVGSLVTVVSPWLTGRIQHRSSRRDVKREAYLRGMRAVAELSRSRTADDLRRVKGETIEARLHIRLVGSREASMMFNDLDELAQHWIDRELRRLSSLPSGESIGETISEALNSETHEDIGWIHETFVIFARLDMRMDGFLAHFRRRREHRILMERVISHRSSQDDYQP